MAYILGDFGRAELILRIWGAKSKYFQGAEEFSFRDLGRSMHYFQGSREHRPPPPPPGGLNTDLAEIKEIVNSKVPNDIYFQIPFLTPGQVSVIISALKPSKAIGIDDLGQRILKAIG